MSVTSTVPTSRRRYLSRDELEQFADITITDATESDDQISQAEEMIDSYVGAQDSFFKGTYFGKATGGSSTTLTLQADQQNSAQTDFYKGMELEVVGGSGAGQRTTIKASTYSGILTFDTLTTAVDSTSVYKIYQLGKFPRKKDVFFDGNNTPNTYYKTIPEAVKRAVAAQVEFMIKMGASYFSSNKSELQSETIGDYSYSKGNVIGSGGSIKNLIAPKAKILLRGLLNRKGILVY